ncbi:MAG: alkaline shock response membrane anchor protein AmaP [Candidatus Omnitrophota bacterium]|nr:alkaline shock response membrane anchor protein AmaP [Candidatus Omnitrophota bacterium]
MRALGVLFYATVLVVVGVLMIVFSVVFSFENLQPQSIKYINDLLIYIQTSLSVRLIIGLSGLLLILISFSFAQLILGRLQREKTIAFSNPAGQVTISLAAVEDLIKRVTSGIYEIKEIKPNVIAGKKGIEVNVRLVLKSEANIPDLTSQLQDLIKAKIQEILGIEEQIIVKIHVAKIVSFEERERRKKELVRDEHAIPFSGYGKV